MASASSSVDYYRAQWQCLRLYEFNNETSQTGVRL
jgi:hypothetical protein